MKHEYNESGFCPHCGVGRHFIQQADRYVYLLPQGGRSLREPRCVGEEEPRAWWEKYWPLELLILIALCVVFYLLSQEIKAQRLQRDIEENHSQIRGDEGSRVSLDTDGVTLVIDPAANDSLLDVRVKGKAVIKP